MPLQPGACLRTVRWRGVLLLLVLLMSATACRRDPSPDARPFPFRAQPVFSASDASASPKVLIAARASKITQLVGDYDAEWHTPTANLTATRYGLTGTDLGVPFRHKGRLYLLFGDSYGRREGDAIATTRSTNPDNGLDLEFLHDASGIYRPLYIPGISQGLFEVPMAGISLGNRMYVYHTTDASRVNGIDKMGRSVLAASDDDGQSFSLLYSLSRQYFVNVSVTQIDSAAWQGLPPAAPNGPGAGLLLFGSGEYRRSNVYLAFQPASQIMNRASIRYWTGADELGEPVWETDEQAAQPLFNQPCIGEFSVTYNTFIRKWIMLYNCDTLGQRGINLRTADRPWGPWSDPQIIFDPWRDGGYCRFIHVSWVFSRCDSVNDEELENTWGGEYGPYQFPDFARGDPNSTTIYFTMSTWNPYTVVLMKASLRLAP